MYPARVPVWNRTESCARLPQSPGKPRQQNPPGHRREQRGGRLSCRKSGPLRFCSFLGPRGRARVADVEMWVVRGTPAAPNAPLHGRALRARVAVAGLESVSAHKGIRVAGCMLNRTSFKRCQLLQERRRRQSFERGGQSLLLLVQENGIARMLPWSSPGEQRAAARQGTVTLD